MTDNDLFIFMKAIGRLSTMLLDSLPSAGDNVDMNLRMAINYIIIDMVTSNSKVSDFLKRCKPKVKSFINNSEI